MSKNILSLVVLAALALPAFAATSPDWSAHRSNGATKTSKLEKFCRSEVDQNGNEKQQCSVTADFRGSSRGGQCTFNSDCWSGYTCQFSSCQPPKKK